MKPARNQAGPPEFRLLLRPQECANSLGISLRGLMNLVDAGEIPYCRIGQRNLRFYVDDLRTWIQERSSQPVRHQDVVAAASEPETTP
jgi:excisionase family DNA binding protein